MDGSQAGQRLQHRPITPVSTEFAITALPEWVYGMATYDRSGFPSVRVNLQSDSVGHRIVFLSRGLGTGPITQLWLLYSDFQLCQQIASTLPIPLFPNESIQSIMSRITGALQVKFAGRGNFNDKR